MKKLFLLGFILSFVLTSTSVLAQFGEPEVRRPDSPKNLYDEGYRSGFGFFVGVSDFGLGVGAQYRKVFSKYTEGLINFKISGIKDPREQTYIDYFFGTKTIPDKYRKVVSFPLTVGLKKRLFAETISDNFRVFASAAGGPVLAYTFPYFQDINGNGFRENNVFIYNLNEPTYDIFTGWKDGESHFGWTGEIQMGIDFNSNFARLQSMQFGYTFMYFDEGLQIMQPNRPDLDPQGRIQYDAQDRLIVEPDYDAKSFYGTAQISFVFGWMWK